MFNEEVTIVQMLGEKTGISKQSGNPWVSRDYLGEYMEGDRLTRFAFSVFGDQNGTLVVGRSYVLNLKIEGREWQGKWFNNVMAMQVYASAVNSQQNAEERESPKPIEPKPAAVLDKNGKLHTNNEGDAKPEDIPF